MKKFKRKPEEYILLQWTGKNLDEVKNFCPEYIKTIEVIGTKLLCNKNFGNCLEIDKDDWIRKIRPTKIRMVRNEVVLNRLSEV